MNLKRISLLLAMLNALGVAAYSQEIPEPPRTEREVIERLRAAGDSAKFTLDDEGRLKTISTHTLFAPQAELSADLKWLTHCLRLEAISLEHPDRLGAFGDGSLKPLGELPHLRVVRLYRCEHVTDEGLKHLGGLGRLEEFALTSNHATGSGLRQLTMCHDLRRLHLGGRGATDEGLAALAELPHIEQLTLSGQNLTDDSLATVAKLPKLKALTLGNSQNFTADGLAHLAALKQLRTLHLWDLPVDESALPTLGRMKQLESLNLRGTRIYSESGIRTLSTALPETRISFKAGEFGPPREE